ncbi:MAG: helix-turn-helix transcriptional regulator [Kangiellaceae bacterium]|jgi:transcriptional regulator with XRE-family HTH domain|nr:helix-turn-helix transcriptional regulator [Kangiellaceae bacterium]
MSLTQRRLDKGWSQEELARHAGLSTRTIQRIESGEKASLESLKCLAAVFDISISQLMQELSMNSKDSAAKESEVLLNSIERDAIDFAQSILSDPKSQSSNPLSKVERDAINYAKKLISKFSE